MGNIVSLAGRKQKHLLNHDVAGLLCEWAHYCNSWGLMGDTEVMVYEHMVSIMDNLGNCATTTADISMSLGITVTTIVKALRGITRAGDFFSKIEMPRDTVNARGFSKPVFLKMDISGALIDLDRFKSVEGV